MTSRVAFFTMGLVGCLSSGSWASVVVSLNNPGSTTLHEIEVRPGDVFGIDVNLSTTNGIDGVAFFVQASASESFNLSGLLDSPPWSSEGTSDIASGRVYFRFLGASGLFGPGSTKIGTLQMSVDPAVACDTYEINVATVRYTHPAVPEIMAGQAGMPVRVHVIPEPATLFLGLGAAAFVSRNRRPRPCQILS